MTARITAMTSEPARPTTRTTRVVVATTALLSFISLWRAAAIVLGDLGSSAFYAGGIAEQAVGNAAPWFVLGVMLFSYCVRAIYLESSIMFVRGGVYRVVKQAMGGTMAKLSVSALLFDYVLTGPISAVSAGLYIVGLLGEVLARFGLALPLSRNVLAAGLATAVILYFWWRNTHGLHESSGDALKIVQLTTVMVVMLLVWSIATLLLHGGHLPPAPVRENLSFPDEALGWLKNTRFPAITAVAVLIGLGHSFLAMSGYESLAQVYREIESPKALNLRRAALVVFVYSVVLTVSVSFLATALIPDGVRLGFHDNMISGIAMHLAGPHSMRLLFQAFVVVVGSLILSGGVNTAIVGSNAVLNRVSEDGVLPQWFRHPHRRYGTTHRFLNLVLGLQVATVVLSGGHIYILGEAYAFGVIWSFTLQAVALVVLRYTSPGAREWRVPINLRIGSFELPIGLLLITMALLSIAVVNLFTKQVATVSGIAFTLALYVVFAISERTTARHRSGADRSLDNFQLLPSADVTQEDLDVRPGNVLVPVRDPNTLVHLKWVLDSTDTSIRDIVVMTVRLLQGPHTGYRDFDTARLFHDYEQMLFTKVVAVAEREGRPVKLLVAPSTNAAHAIAHTAVRLRSTEIVVGESATFNGAELAAMVGEAWDRIEKDRNVRSLLVVCKRDRTLETFHLGPHVPPLTEEDLELIHTLWLEAVAKYGLDIHHRDVVRTALEDLAGDMSAAARQRAMDLIG
ncbi:MAG: APC family permease, partial [Acidobacteria bacterium]